MLTSPSGWTGISQADVALRGREGAGSPPRHSISMTWAKEQRRTTMAAPKYRHPGSHAAQRHRPEANRDTNTWFATKLKGRGYLISRAMDYDVKCREIK